MSENLCYTDAYARQVEASVVGVDDDANAVLLEPTVFYSAAAGSRRTPARSSATPAGRGG